MSFILAEKFTYKTNHALDESVLRWSLLKNGGKCSFTFSQVPLQGLSLRELRCGGKRLLSR